MMRNAQNDIREFLKAHVKLRGGSSQYEKYLARPGSLLAEGFTVVEVGADFEKVSQVDPAFHTIALCISGSAVINGGTSLPARHMTFIPAGRSFVFTDFTRDFRADLLLFTPQFIRKGLAVNEAMDDLLPAEEGLLHCYPLFPEAYADVSAKFAGISRELEWAAPFQPEMVRLYLMQILYSFNRVCETCLLQAKYKDSRKYSLAHEFRKLVNQHFREVRSVAEYASMLHITPKYLSECTQARYRYPAIKLIHQRLLLESELLLLYSSMSIKEIAHVLRFDTTAHFARFFRSYKGIAPAAYRNKP